MTTAHEQLLTTALHERHIALGGRMVPFAGWEMPIQYEGVMAEHRAVRESAGLFDVSHMGQIAVWGDGAGGDLQRVLSNDIARLADDGSAQYTLLTNDMGGIEDDLIVYRQAPDAYLLVVNAANTAHDLGLLEEGAGAGTKVRDVSSEFAMLALQGPCALDALADACGIDVRSLDAFRFVQDAVEHVPVTVATTGYTGERGCEILVRPEAAGWLWDRLVADERVVPAGLGARDTLRLEVCFPLHGNDIGPQTSAVSAGLGWVCGWGTDFVGSSRLEQERVDGPVRRLVALAATDRGIPRPGCEVYADEASVGSVTSGTMSPSLGIGIALAYVSAEYAEPGTALEIDVRGRRVSVEVRRKPLFDPDAKESR